MKLTWMIMPKIQGQCYLLGKLLVICVRIIHLKRRNNPSNRSKPVNPSALWMVDYRPSLLSLSAPVCSLIARAFGATPNAQ